MKWLLRAATDRKTRLYQLEIHCVLFDRQIVHIRSTAVLMFWIIFVTTPHIWSSRSHLHLFSKTEAASLYTFVVHSTVDSSQLPHGVDGVEPHFIHIIHLNGWEFFLLEFERTLATVVQIISWSETFRDGNERIEKYWFYFLFISFIMLMLRLVEYLSFMKIVFLHGNSLEYLDDTWKSNISWH